MKVVMARPNKTVDCNLRQARERLQYARAYLAAAELALVESGDEYAAVSAGNAVLAGIAAVDAICGHALRNCSRSPDHRDAIELVKSATSAGPEYGKSLGRLLDLKDAAHYGFTEFSRSDARKSVRLAESLVHGAESLFGR